MVSTIFSGVFEIEASIEVSRYADVMFVGGKRFQGINIMGHFPYLQI